MVWAYACMKEEYGVHREKGAGNGTGRRTRGRLRRRNIDIVREDVEVVGVKGRMQRMEKWKRMIRCGYP